MGTRKQSPAMAQTWPCLERRERSVDGNTHITCMERAARTAVAMNWSFNRRTMSTDDDQGPLRRVQIDEAIHRLIAAGITNQLELTRILAALTGLSTKEIRF